MNWISLQLNLSVRCVISVSFSFGVPIPTYFGVNETMLTNRFGNCHIVLHTLDNIVDRAGQSWIHMKKSWTILSFKSDSKIHGFIEQIFLTSLKKPLTFSDDNITLQYIRVLNIVTTNLLSKRQFYVLT